MHVIMLFKRLFGNQKVISVNLPKIRDFGKCWKPSKSDFYFDIYSIFNNKKQPKMEISLNIFAINTDVFNVKHKPYSVIIIESLELIYILF